MIQNLTYCYDEIGEIYNDTEFDVLLLGYIRVDKKGDFSPPLKKEAITTRHQTEVSLTLLLLTKL